MRISISRRQALVGLAAAGVVPPGSGRAEVVTQLETATKGDKIVALTFDACETRTPAFLDTAISDFLIGRRIPFTVFACGRFARHNQDALAALSRLDFVEIENHSMNHDNHMERMDQATVRREVAEAETMLKGITGKRTRYFRFPAGNYDAQSLAAVEGMGYRVVHWSFASGDPMKSLTPEAETAWVLEKTRPGGILIFHINGRGWSTGKALPGIVDALQSRGYRFARLDSVLK
jgi:peptidoglycan/xylan/chitin deacetylase (PgdA/CDA1 family)